MRNVRLALICALLGGSLLATAAPALAAGGYKDSVGVAQAQAKVRAAARELERAKAAYREARDVLDATRLYVGIYGVNVGRWVWLANDVCWPRSEWRQLFYVVNRESGGSPKALNTQGSGAAGLLQTMPGWYHGQWGYPPFDPFDPREELKAGVWIWKHNGWAPWAL